MFKTKGFLLGALLCLSVNAGYCDEGKLQLHPTLGPAHIALGDHLLSLDLPEGYAFFNKDETAELLRKSGSSSTGVLGMIVPRGKNSPSFEILCRFEDIGYVKDDDAEKLNADELLQQCKEGTKEGNNQRKLMGIPPFYVSGWAEKPSYDKAHHHVIWAIGVKDQDSASAPVACVNYNTRLLGRRGVVSMNLVSEPNTLEENKTKVADILTKTTFEKGENYSDYQPGKDKDSGLGIAGLILGGGAVAAAAKMGIFGGLWKFLLGGIILLKKFAIVAIVAIGASFRKIFSKKKPVGSPVASVNKEGNV